CRNPPSYSIPDLRTSTGTSAGNGNTIYRVQATSVGLITSQGKLPEGLGHGRSPRRRRGTLPLIQPRSGRTQTGIHTAGPTFQLRRSETTRSRNEPLTTPDRHLASKLRRDRYVEHERL